MNSPLFLGECRLLLAYICVFETFSAVFSFIFFFISSCTFLKLMRLTKVMFAKTASLVPNTRLVARKHCTIGGFVTLF